MIAKYNGFIDLDKDINKEYFKIYIRNFNGLVVTVLDLAIG